MNVVICQRTVIENSKKKRLGRRQKRSLMGGILSRATSTKNPDSGAALFRLKKVAHYGKNTGEKERRLHMPSRRFAARYGE